MSCNSIICIKHGPLISLDQHANNIARFLIFENPYDIGNVSPWFQIASGISEVKYISDKFDGLLFMCGPAMEYEDEKSKFHSKLIKALTFFNFVWGGFEAYIDTLELINCPFRTGKINKVNYYLKENYIIKNTPPQHYTELVDKLKEFLIINPWYGDSTKLFEISDCMSDELHGLNIVYKIRNMFAHGAFTFSEPNDWNDTKPYDVEIISASSRIVLLTMQMLLLISTEDLNFKVPQLNCNPEKGPQAVRFVKKLHLKNYKHC